MAESSDEQDPFNCSICLHLLNNPVTTACGHSFCMNCLNECWDREVQKGCYSCPQCRQMFIPRPALSRSTVLAEIVERMKKEAPEEEAEPEVSPALNFAVSGDVECDVCTETKLKAVKSCLVCLASYCESHIQTHYTSPALKRHKLVNASPHLLNQICSQHDKLLELYCCRDQQLICMQCAVINHQNHNMTSSAAERQNIMSKGRLKKSLDALQLEMVQREKKVQELRQAMDSHKLSAQAAVENTEKVFNELINSMKRAKAKITELIRAQEKAEVMTVEELILTLEQETSDLRRRHDELGQLSQVEDDIYFIQNFSTISQYQCSNLSNISIRQHLTFDEIETVICKLKNQLYDLCKEEVVWISEKVPTVQITDNKKNIQYLPSQPKTREEFLIYSTELNLNPTSACKQLSVQFKSVSRRNRESADYYDTACTYQVLCKESLSGRCYFEVQFGGSGCSIVFSNEKISKGGTVILGSNNRSWKFNFPAAKLSVTHNNQQTNSLLSKIGVFLDQDAGIVSFYNVSDKMILLHRMQITFPQPLYTGFSLQNWGSNSSVTICNRPKQNMIF